MSDLVICERQDIVDIANAIRTASDSDDTFTLNEMATAIGGLSDSGELSPIVDAINLKNNGSNDSYSFDDISNAILNLGYSNIPSYHYAEAGRVVQNIRQWKTEHPNSLVFGAISDNHVFANDSTYGPNTERSIRHASFALETVGCMAECDFVANLGDNCWENGIDTDNALEGATYTHDSTMSALNRITSFRLVGNHDRSSVTTKTYELNGIYNSFNDYGTTKIRGFGYKDFTDKKVRVICLNTTDYLNASGGCAMSYDQKDFFIRALDLSSKNDATEWQILLLSHIPLDWNGGDYNTANDIKEILSSYESGNQVEFDVINSYCLNETPSNYSTFNSSTGKDDDAIGCLSYNYSGKNQASLIANIHGHVHTNAYGKLSELKTLRMATPNSCFSLNKSESYPEYGDYSITSTEAAKIVKVANTAKDTSATFYCVDLASKTITAFAYGAGVDRFAVYGADMHSISLNLTNASSSNNAVSVEKNGSYITTISANEGYEIRSVVVKMGDIDITNNVYSNGVISIAEVTDDVVITVKASVPAFEYVVPDLDGATRMTWYVSGSTFGTGNNNGHVAVGVSTSNNYSFADRESGTFYLMPIPANATNILIETTDASFVNAQFMIVSDAGGALTRVYDSGMLTKNSSGVWSAEFDRSLGNWIGINMVYSHDGSIKPAWGYNVKDNVTVTFSNGTVSDSGGSGGSGENNEPTVNYNNLFSTSDADYSVGRLSSSGGVNTSYTNGFVSGYIEAAYKDVIRAKSANTAFVSNYPIIAFYNSSKTFIGALYSSNTSQITLSNDSMMFTCNSGVLSSSTYGSMAFIRVMGYGKPDGFIITKNEEIS